MINIKQVCYFVFLFTAFVTVGFVDSAKSQGTGVSIDPSSFPQKKEEQPLFWKAKSEFVISNGFDAPNGINLIKSSVARNKTLFTVERGKYNFLVETKLIVPTNRNPQKVFAGLGVGVSRKFNSIDVSSTGRYYHSRRQSFAVADIEFAKTLKLNQKAKLRPFSNISWYIPTESSNNTVSSGFVWRNGFDFETELGPTEFNFGSQLIADSGSIQRGGRIGVNTNVTCLIPIYIFRMGPRIGYTKFNQNMRNRFNFGFVFKVR